MIESLEGHTEPIFPTDELMAATNDLQLSFETRGKSFSKLVLEIAFTSEQGWRYTADFSYS